MSDKTRFRLYGLLALLVVAGLSTFMLSSSQRGMSFRGTVVGKGGEGLDHPTSICTLTIAGDDGKTYEWGVMGTDEGYFLVGDYVVKLKGKSKLAVFRHGKQLRGLPFYLNEEVSKEALPSGEGKAAASGGTPPGAPAAEAVPSGPAGGPVPAPARPADVAGEKPPTEDQALQLIEESKRLWAAGDRQGAIARAEQALNIRIRLYGENHALVTELRSMITAAREAMEKSAPASQPTPPARPPG